MIHSKLNFQDIIFVIIFRHHFRHAIKSLSLCSLKTESTNFVQTWVYSVFLLNFCRLHVRNFQNKITCLLRTCFWLLTLKKWCNIRVYEGYFVAKYKKFPGVIVYFVRFADVSAFFTSMHIQVWLFDTPSKLRHFSHNPYE